MENIGERLKQERLRKGMSMRKLTEVTGVSSATICEFEKGKGTPLFSTVVRLMDGLGLEFEVVPRSKV